MTEFLIAELFPIDTRYNVIFEGDLVLEGSRDPECDLARILLSRRYSGVVTMLDGRTGKARSIINVERAAKITVEEGPNGPRFVKYRRQTVVETPYSLEDASLVPEVA
jgi:hypothetical protein